MAKDIDDEEIPFLCMASLKGTSALWFLVVSNMFLAISSTLGNIVILAAFSKESSLHPPSKILLRSLALTDLCVGLFVEPFFVTFLISLEIGTKNICSQVIIIGVFIDICFCVLSLLTLTAISVDRLLALLLGIRYRQVVTFKRVLMIVICFWTLCVTFSVTSFWTHHFLKYYSLISVLLCVVISTCCYIKIYRKLFHHQAQIQEHVHQGQQNGHAPLNIARYRKTVSTALWVQLTLVTCYLPAGIVTALVVVEEMTAVLFMAWTFSLTLVSLNSTLNPILYCWKIRNVRRAVVETVRQIYCCLSS
ncbi:melanocortin receptor 4-like [Orbicella faveolata]|uniref:melanocortin receptor 4-like n=1 Tax=Orbicella faveolata TaxID=48498 RepID=UPI0009E6207B|nr:melanocortin receptor 4-like [Orbicella faveolata]